MKCVISFLAILLTSSAIVASEQRVELKTPACTLYGTLLVPDTVKSPPVVLLIAGSGPTDRNGNSKGLPRPNNSLEMLAEGLAANKIASLRYDKRGIGESAAAMTKESDLRFETYIDDAVAWANQLARDERFRGVFIAGHSEGALIGAIAAQRAPVIGFISIAGLSQPADAVLRRQLAGKLPADLADFSEKALVALKRGTTVEDVPPALAALYRPSVQPYLMSWFRYDPAAEIGKVKVPVLVLQGTTDIQVSVDDAKALAAAAPHPQLEIIEGMNHVLKTVAADTAKQIASYSDPDLPVAPQLLNVVVTYVKAH